MKYKDWKLRYSHVLDEYELLGVDANVKEVARTLLCEPDEVDITENGRVKLRQTKAKPLGESFTVVGRQPGNRIRNTFKGRG